MRELQSKIIEKSTWPLTAMYCVINCSIVMISATTTMLLCDNLTHLVAVELYLSLKLYNSDTEQSPGLCYVQVLSENYTVCPRIPTSISDNLSNSTAHRHFVSYFYYFRTMS